MGAYDLVIRGGLIVDGTGGEPFTADLAIDAGKISKIGAISEKGHEEIDAQGLIVTPGFVDIHTHYDGQATWDDRLTPSSQHGVTTVVMGNCGVGFAPCKAEDHSRLIRLMEGVEDIPFPVLTEGLPWNWESFEDYLAALEARRFDIDVATQLPHAALRVFVMGERGANREEATEDDIAQMATIARDAIEAGALGFSTSRTLNHRTSDGQPSPTITASEAELTGIAMALESAGKGVLQFVSDFDEPKKETAMLRRIVERSGRPLSVSLAQSDVAPEGWRHTLRTMEEATADGLTMRAQVCGRPVGVLLGLELTLNPFSGHDVYKEIAKRPFEERVARLREPEFRARLLGSMPKSKNPFVTNMLRNFGKIFVLSDAPDYEPSEENTLAHMARERGISPQELALDLMLEDDGKGMLYLPFLNYAGSNLDPSYEMLKHPNTVPGLSDGGAHVGTICDGSFPTSMLTHWTRDRTRGPKFPLEWIVKRQSYDTAEAVGLMDRGLLKPEYRADINIIDYENLTLHKPSVAYDLPAGGRRLIQTASGYVATIVAGEVISRNGQPTKARPGRLVRGAKQAPAEIQASA